MKVLFIDGNKDRANVNLGLGFLAQYIRNEHEVEILSMGFHSDEEIINKVTEKNIVGISCTTQQYPDCITLAIKIKKEFPSAKIAMGGHTQLLVIRK